MSGKNKRVAAMLAWLDSIEPGDAHWCVAALSKPEVETNGGSIDARLCFDMAQPERGLVRIEQQEAAPGSPLGVVLKSTWLVTELGLAVQTAYRKRERRAEIRAAAVREVSTS